MTDVRKGQYKGKLSRDAFRAHFLRSFFDPNFAAEKEAIDRLEAIAWANYEQSRKSPVTRKAGPGFADPDYDLSVEWIEARAAITAAEAQQKDPSNHRKSWSFAPRRGMTGHVRVKCQKPIVSRRKRFRSCSKYRSRPNCSISACSRRNTIARFIPARPVYRQQCRSVTGRAVATPIIASAKPMIG
jgi:hypothetical protein